MKFCEMLPQLTVPSTDIDDGNSSKEKDDSEIF